MRFRIGWGVVEDHGAPMGSRRTGARTPERTRLRRHSRAGLHAHVAMSTCAIRVSRHDGESLAHGGAVGMERGLWSIPAGRLTGISRTGRAGRFTRPTSRIVRVSLWSVAHDRPVCRACEKRKRLGVKPPRRTQHQRHDHHPTRTRRSPTLGSIPQLAPNPGGDADRRSIVGDDPPRRGGCCGARA